MTLTERLDALKAADKIAAYEAPQPNRGLAKGMLPWVVMPITGGPAKTYYNDHDLNRDIALMEQFGPTQMLGR
jgi:hypothetical protein